VEVNELCGLFVGRWAKYVYTLLLGLYFYVIIWAYSVAVSISLTSVVAFPGLTKGITWYAQTQLTSQSPNLTILV